MANVESLALGRARRQSAGSRMRALLDGVFEAEEGFEEIENDDEFEDKGDGEGDVYASDFQSTDDEADNAADAGERQLQQEVKEAQRAERRKARAHTSGIPKPTKPDRPHHRRDGERPAKKRRISIPILIDQDTGEVVDTATRKSSRSTTIQAKHELQSKLKELVQRRASLPKREKVQQREKTQDELIRDALETEEENIASLDMFLTEEEERKLKNANMKKTVIEGPLMRWISRSEKTKAPMVVEVSLPVLRQTPTPTPPPPTYTGGVYQYLQRQQIPSYGHYTPSYVSPAPSDTGPALPTRPSLLGGDRSYISQTRNYLVIEARGATPGEDMGYLFGTHVDWDEVKVLPKHRPTERIPTPCAVTGRPAKYVDPHTGIPYADLNGYQTIQGLLRNRYIWSEALGCYVGDEEESIGATGVPDGWVDAVAGRGAGTIRG